MLYSSLFLLLLGSASGFTVLPQIPSRVVSVKVRNGRKCLRPSRLPDVLVPSENSTSLSLPFAVIAGCRVRLGPLLHILPVQNLVQTSSSSLYDGSEALDALTDAVTDAAPDAAAAASGVSLPDIGLSLPALGGDGDPPIAIIAGVGILFAAAYAAMKAGGDGDAGGAPAPAASSSTSSSSSAASSDNDVSIPYDAAARMAYCNSKGISAVTDEADFQAYKVQYEATAVAEATAKKAARDAA